MKEIVIKVPDNKVSFFVELVKQLGIEITEQVDIPEEHKKLVGDRIHSSAKEDMLTWGDARKQLKFKNKSA